MYELKGKAKYYIGVVRIWYMMVVFYCNLGDPMMTAIGLFMGCMPYVVMGMILFMYCIDKILKAYDD